MRTIHKHPIPVVDRFTILVPSETIILSVGVQRGDPQIWIMLDDDMPATELRSFRVIGTGHKIENDEHLKFIGTVLLFSDTLVLHIFEEIVT